jgi:hypothetical protein
VGDGSGVHRAAVPPVFKLDSVIDVIPGKVGQIFVPNEFKNCRPRQRDLAVESFDIRVVITGEDLRQIRVREDASMEEILGGTFIGEDIPAEDKFKLVVKPLNMKD